MAQLASSDPADATALLTTSSCRFCVPDLASFHISHGREIVVHPHRGACLRNIRQWLLGSAWGSLCYQRGVFLIHASAVMVESQAVLFCAPAKEGKSTLAAQLTARGYALVSDDLCHLEVPAVGPPLIFRSAPRLKLWKDSLAHFSPDRYSVEKDPSRAGKFHVEGVAHVHTDKLPVRGVYLLAFGPLSIRRIFGLAALRQFWSASTYRPKLMAAEHSARYRSQSLSFLQRTPVWEFSRPRDLESIGTAIDALASEWRRYHT